MLLLGSPLRAVNPHCGKLQRPVEGGESAEWYSGIRLTYLHVSLLEWSQCLLLLGDPESVAGEYGRHSLYKMLGYFSLVGLLRLHSLLGDYYQAIKVLENIELNKKVITCFPLPPLPRARVCAKRMILKDKC